MKTRIFVILALVASIAMFSTGAFAYFSAQRNTATGSVSAGTLGILIASVPGTLDTTTPPADSAFADTVVPPWHFDKLAPGAERMGCLWVMNTGNLASVEAHWNFKDLVYAGGTGGVKLADRLEITQLFTKEDSLSPWSWPAALLPGGAWYSGGYYDIKGDGKIDLAEMASWSDKTGMDYDWANDVNPFLTVAPGGKGAICMAVKMMNGSDTEDNPYQGSSMTYNISIKAFNPAP